MTKSKKIIRKEIEAENERLEKLAEQWLAKNLEFNIVPSAKDLTLLLISVHAQAQLSALKRIQADLFQFAPIRLECSNTIATH